MTITAGTCATCGEGVEFDTASPGLTLDPKRDKIKHPKALHICSGKPASLTAQFKKDPQKFLDSHIIVVDEHEQLDSNNRHERCRFALMAADKNAVRLKFQLDSSADAIDAYWLPWLSHHATSMTLGADADFFFTSELTNCRFSVLDPDPKKPRVAHVAGDLTTPTARNNAEVDDGFRAKEEGTRVRSLSISNSRDVKPFRQPVIPKKHDYTGQTGEKERYSSAFVFGVRGSDGNWKFYAQVVKGTMTEGFFDHELTENLQRLNFVEI